MTADGWRARKQGGIVYQFVYDPQGSVQQRHTDGSYTGGYAAYDRSTFEGYGALRQANKGSTGAIVGQHDPAGFGGQFGYYTDAETGLALCQHRYYDSSVGRFLNRDPIGYAGGRTCTLSAWAILSMKVILMEPKVLVAPLIPTTPTVQIY